MFSTIPYKDGFIYISNYDKRIISASITIPIKTSKGIIWDRKEQRCKSLFAAKIFISRNM